MAAPSARGFPIFDNEETEILACHRAICFAIEAEFRELVIEGDNVFVMRALSRSDKQFSWLRHILQVYVLLS